MTTIDNIDIQYYFQYARRVQTVEETTRTFQLDQARSIPPQTQIVDLHPKLHEIESLFGFRRSTQPWARFVHPENFTEQRRSTFAFDRICPSLGSQEQQKTYFERLKTFSLRDQDSEEGEKEGERDPQKKKGLIKLKKEKQILLRCFDQIDQINKMINFVVSRVGQFLRG